jgi:hypothetical protein
MSTHDGIDDDVEVNISVPVAGILEYIESNPVLLLDIANLVRNQIVGPMARRMGNTAGKTAQKKTPLASKPQIPGTQRVW